MCFSHSKHQLLLALIFCVVFFALWNGTKGPLVLDDFRNLSPLLNTEKPDYLHVILSNESGPLGRSVSMATFAMNHWIREGINVSDLKVTNLFIHLINALLLYLFITILFKSHYKIDQRHLLALAITACWALSPVNTSVVFYAVQRMAMLSTLFVLAGCLIYLLMRSGCHKRSKKTNFYGFLLFICWILATLSKENGILLPVFIICIELCFFDELRLWIKHTGRNKKIVCATVLLVFISIITGLVILKGYLDYDHLNYKLSDRLFTQPVVLVDYVYRLVMPFNMDIGLYFDDIAVRTTFWNQKTVTSTFIIIFVISICLYSLLRNRFCHLSFGLLFFLIGHSIESTIFPLEIYYYHRNYLPSIGLYFFLVLFIYQCFSHIGTSRVPVVVLTIYLSLFTFFSYEISKVWSSEEKIVSNAYFYHPSSVRANMIMVELLSGKGKLEQALEVNEKIIENKTGDAFRPVIQRIYLYCRADLTLPQHEYNRFTMNINRFHVLEVSNALNNLFDIYSSRKCTGVNLVDIINSLSIWVDEQIDKKVYSPEQIWHLEYYVIEFLLALQQRELALQRLDRYIGLNNASAVEYFRTRIKHSP